MKETGKEWPKKMEGCDREERRKTGETQKTPESKIKSRKKWQASCCPFNPFRKRRLRLLSHTWWYSVLILSFLYLDGMTWGNLWNHPKKMPHIQTNSQISKSPRIKDYTGLHKILLIAYETCYPVNKHTLPQVHTHWPTPVRQQVNPHWHYDSEWHRSEARYMGDGWLNPGVVFVSSIPRGAAASDFTYDPVQVHFFICSQYINLKWVTIFMSLYSLSHVLKQNKANYSSLKKKHCFKAKNIQLEYLRLLSPSPLVWLHFKLNATETKTWRCFKNISLRLYSKQMAAILKAEVTRDNITYTINVY